MLPRCRLFLIHAYVNVHNLHVWRNTSTRGTSQAFPLNTCVQIRSLSWMRCCLVSLAKRHVHSSNAGRRNHCYNHMYRYDFVNRYIYQAFRWICNPLNLSELEHCTQKRFNGIFSHSPVVQKTFREFHVFVQAGMNAAPFPDRVSWTKYFLRSIRKKDRRREKRGLSWRCITSTDPVRLSSDRSEK